MYPLVGFTKDQTKNIMNADEILINYGLMWIVRTLYIHNWDI